MHEQIVSVANATGDLIMMGAWYCAMSTVEAEPIPVSNIRISVIFVTTFC